MEENFDIHHIPPGLEYREEYAARAIGMYRRQRKLMLLKKLGIWCAALLVATTAMYVLLNDKNQQTPIAIQTTTSALHTADATTTIDEDSDTQQPLNINDDVASTDKEASMPKAQIDSATESNEITTVNSEIKTRANQKNADSQVVLIDITKKIGKNLKREEGAATEAMVDIDQNLLQSEWNNEKAAQTIAVTASESSTEISEANYGLNSEPVSLENGSQAFQPGERLGSIPVQMMPQYGSLCKPQNRVLHKASKWQAFVQLGLNPLSNYASKMNDAQMDYQLGLGAQYYHRRGFYFEALAAYQTFSGISKPYVVESRTYGQGVDVKTISIETDRLHYAGLYTSAGYMLSEQHRVAVGLGAQYLLTGTNTLKTSNTLANQASEMTATSSNGYVQGFRRVPLSVTLAYQYQIKRNIALGIRYQFGLSDITLNHYFTDGLMDRNSHLGLYLQIRLK